ncbi:FAD/NAD(P)-binding domain-containing protein [Penicillium capsulatum]|uniref:FAD/NAD(P)-binding domain-containing protein n=1 Tax=Penicillium capsulatum TaxID=69766 RepID=A0A9W9LWI0_9EURO|nr:FAD/NAD(P)-binding domain-containing protein [Penicillium capsulatum]KAJ6122060.1 FAD/NAD(P)-binding domain-containing protein [Penicillium capsulatum]
MDSEILIVGAGIFGVSTAYHLAKRSANPSRITILDCAPAPSGDAASTDINKIIRADYSNPLYMDLAFEAVNAWQNDPLFANAGVYHQTGWIAMGECGSDVADRIRRNFQQSGRPDPTRDMTEDEVRRSWGGVLQDANLRPFESYYFNPLAGWADAGRALELMATAAIKMGVRYQIGEARRIVLGDRGVEGVETRSHELYTARKVILSTGAWTSQLMDPVEEELGLSTDLRIESQLTATGVCVGHFQLSKKEHETYDRLPVYVYGSEGEVLPPTASGILKFTVSNSFKNTVEMNSGRRISVPPMNSQFTAPKSLQDEFMDSIRGRLPRLLDHNRQVDYYRLCWDAITPTQHPLITLHPDSRLSNLYLAVGGSFHCWKFLPTIGQYVANVLDGISNGPDRDEAWKWKERQRAERGVHDSLIPNTELHVYDC